MGGVKFVIFALAWAAPQIVGMAIVLSGSPKQHWRYPTGVGIMILSGPLAGLAAGLLDKW